MEHYINDSNEEAVSAKGERKGFGPNTMCFFNFSKQTNLLCQFLNLSIACCHVVPRGRVTDARRGVEGPSRDHVMVSQLCCGESLRCHGQRPTWRKKLPGRAMATGHRDGLWYVVMMLIWKSGGVIYVFFDDVSWWFLQILSALIQLQCWRMIRVSTRIIQILRDCSCSPQESCFPCRYLQLS